MLVSLRDAWVGSTVRGCLSLVLEGAEDGDTTAAAEKWFCCDLAAVVRVLLDIEAKMMDCGSLVLRVFCANCVGIGFGVGLISI